VNPIKECFSQSEVQNQIYGIIVLNIAV